MIWTRALGFTPILIALVFLTCSEPPTSHQLPQFHYGPVLNDYVCEQQGDFDVDVVYLYDSCELAADGFDDEDATFRFSDAPHSPTPTSSLPLRAYRVWEIRHSPLGAGRRVADEGWANDSTITTNSITVKFIRELEGVSLHTWYGTCPGGTVSASDCMDYAVANHTYHDEPWLCIWNPTVAASGDVDNWCVGSTSNTIGELATVDRLPLATFNRFPTPEQGYLQVCPFPWPTGLQWTYDASASTDADGQALSYHWDYRGTQDSTSNPSHFKCWENDPNTHETVRLRIRDTQGGMDLRTLSF